MRAFGFVIFCPKFALAVRRSFMNHIVASTKCAAISILFSAFLFVACGDESSVSSDPVTDSSSDTEISSSDEGSPSSSSSSKKASSSSSRKDVKMSSSEDESASSSSGYVLRDSLCSSEMKVEQNIFRNMVLHTVV